eukprot:3068142-Pleurochrysis_carterae.AAC.2
MACIGCQMRSLAKCASRDVLMSARRARWRGGGALTRMPDYQNRKAEDRERGEGAGVQMGLRGGGLAGALSIWFGS